VNLQSRVNHHQTLLMTLIKIAALPPWYQIGNRHDLHHRYHAMITERNSPPKGGGLPLSRSLMSNHLSSSRLKGGRIKTMQRVWKDSHLLSGTNDPGADETITASEQDVV